jgi:uncharacterized protein YoxC
MFKFIKREGRKVLLNTIDCLEDEIKELKSRLKTAEHNNIILLENAEELRKDVKVKEDIIKSLLEDIEALKEESFKNAKKPRKKAIKKED